MDLRFTEAEEQFRREVREFLNQELSEEYQRSGGVEGALDDISWPITVAFEKKLAQKGWLTLAWPKEYGGQGRSVIEQLIYNEEMAYHRAPGIGGQAVRQIGPTIIVYGNEEQKKRFIGAISRREIYFCQGFSEPNAGSDLASLQTRAVEDGDDYVINGEKIWTTYAQRADYCWLGARTNPNVPKHRGITTFVVPMNTPGIRIIPIINMAGEHRFNQVVFQDVRISKEYLIGQKDRGWYQMTTTLDFERSGVSRSAGCRRTVEELIEFARETRRNGQTLADNPIIRNKLAQLAIEAEVGRMIAYKVAWMQNAGLIPNAEASMSKVFGSELMQRVAQVGVEMIGLHGQLDESSNWAPMAGRLIRDYLTSFSATIGAGTSEIQRNIIATRGLGMPR